MENVESSYESQLTLDQEKRTYLNSAAKWSKFIAITGFVLFGLIAIIYLFFGAIMGTASAASELGLGVAPILMVIPMLLFIGLFIWFYLYLYKFATKMRMALEHEDDMSLTESFKNLKSYFKFQGVLLIIFLALYGGTFLIMILFGAGAGIIGLFQ